MVGEPISAVDAKALASIARAQQVIQGLLSPQGTPKPEDTEVELEPTPGADETPVDAEPQGDAEPALDAEPTPEGTEPQPVRSRKLTLDGQEEEVTEDEAYLGYMRQRDST